MPYCWMVHPLVMPKHSRANSNAINLVFEILFDLASISENADNVTLNVFEKLKLWAFSAAAEEEELIHKAATLDEAVQIFDLILVRRAKSSTETLSVADIVAHRPSAGLGNFFLILLNQTMTSGLF